MWHAHCATVAQENISATISAFLCSGHKGDLIEPQIWPENHFCDGQSQVRFFWSPVSWSGPRRERWFAILYGQRQWYPILLWVNSCSVFLPPPWLFAWTSHYFIPWVSVVSLTAVPSGKKCYLCLMYADWDTVLHRCHPCVGHRNILSDIKKYKWAVPIPTKLIKLLGFLKSILIIYCNKQYHISFHHFSQLLIS